MQNQGKVFFGLLLVMSMELIDLTVLNTILPMIAGSLDIDAVDARIAITSYIISLGIFIPLSVWVSNRFGYKMPIVLTIAGFIGSSVMCGFAPSLLFLVVFRTAQGFFGALLLPLTQTTMIRLSDSMLKVSATISMYMTASAAVGQLLGAFLAEYISWRAVFFINAPVGLIGIFFIQFYFKDPFEKQKTSLDWVGLILIGLSIGLIFTLSNIMAFNSISYLIKIAMGVIPIFLSIFYIFVYKKIKNPILNFELFKHKGYSLINLVIFTSKLSLYWLFFAFPIYLYLYIDLAITTVALIMASIAVSTFCIKKFSVLCIQKFGMKTVTITSSFLILLVMVAWGFILEYRVHLSLILALIPIFGLLSGTYQTATTAYKLQVVPDKYQGDGNVQGKTIFMIASAFSISFLGMVYDISRYILQVEVHMPLFIWALEYCFIVSGIIQFLITLLVLFLKDDSVT
jgi:MFS family permease